MQKFNGQNLLEFIEHFQSDHDCKEYLANIKWRASFICLKCEHNACQIREDYSRACNKCSYTESASANTLFHKVKLAEAITSRKRR
jgi:hypothetical protein